MIWSDGVAGIFKGIRTFELKARDDASTDFVMQEHFSGVMFALTKGMLRISLQSLRPTQVISGARPSELRARAWVGRRAGVMPNPSCSGPAIAIRTRGSAGCPWKSVARAVAAEILRSCRSSTTSVPG